MNRVFLQKDIVEQITDKIDYEKRGTPIAVSPLIFLVELRGIEPLTS